MGTKIIVVKDRDPLEAGLRFAGEISRTLILRDGAGSRGMADCVTEADKETFMTGYISGIFDYITARREGRLAEPVIEIVTKRGQDNES